MTPKKSKFLTFALTFALCFGAICPAHAYSTGYSGRTSAISIGEGQVGVIDSNRVLWMWGHNSSGQVGNNGTTWAFNPAHILDSVSSLSCGMYFTAAVKQDGTLWTWGSNSFGALGNGKTTDSHIPVKISSDVTAVSCGNAHGAAIKNDGTLWTWGMNNRYQLGDKTKIDSSIPKKVLDDVLVVSCGAFHTAAVQKDGTLSIWGDGSEGQLGNSTFELLYTAPLPLMRNVATVNCGHSYTAIIKTDGTLWTCGDNSSGQLGDGSNEASNRPVKIMENVTAVSCGTNHTAAIKNDGTLWMWGKNDHGKLGLGNFSSSSYNTPQKVLDDVVAVSCGDLKTIAVKADGSVWEWGAISPDENSWFPTPANVSSALLPDTNETNPQMPNESGFADVPVGEWYYEPVIWAVKNNITDGTSATTFTPGRKCTEAEIITFLWRANGCPNPTIANPYSDLSRDAYYYDAAIWAYEQGLRGGRTFGGNNPCKRMTTVMYLWNLAGQPAAPEHSFSDVPDVSALRAAISWAVHHGITTGTGNNTFSPEKECTRGEIVTFLYRTYAK